MTNSWVMLFDYLNEELYGSSDIDVSYAPGVTGAEATDTLKLSTTSEVVITEPAAPVSRPKTAKDVTFWKYEEGKILREVEAYLSSTYKGHYVGEESKVQTLDLIDSIGDAEAFCRSNAIKYLSRFGKKDGKNPKDLLKVIHYAILLYHFSDLPFTEDAKETFSATGR